MPEPSPGRLDLHLDRPPPVAILHRERGERRPADRAEGSEIGVASTIQNPQGRARDPIADDLLRREGTRLCLPERSRADDQVRLATGDRGEKVGERGRVVRVIPVEEDHDVRWILGELGETLQACGAVSPLILPRHLGPVGAGDRRRPIGRAVVGHDDAPDVRAGNLGEDEGKRALFVQRGDDDVDDHGDEVVVRAGLVTQYSRAMRVRGVAAILCVLAVGSAARADDRPTSGDMSLLSGRTLGNGETALAAALGWPGLWAQVTLAPSSTLNVGIRGFVLYGSPLMGLGAGVGGGGAVPVRIWVFGEGSVDLSLAIEPAFMVGEGALAGQEGTFADDFGWAGWAEAGALLGMQASSAVTLTLGLLGGGGYVRVADAGDGSHVIGTTTLVLGVEALMSRDTLLFAELRGGWGFAPEALFDGHYIVRVSLGIAYLL